MDWYNNIMHMIISLTYDQCFFFLYNDLSQAKDSHAQKHFVNEQLAY